MNINIMDSDSLNSSENSESDTHFQYMDLKNICNRAKDLCRIQDDTKYKIVLEFMNCFELVPYKAKSLTDIKKFTKDDLRSDMVEKKEIILEYIDQLKSTVGIKSAIDSKTKVTDINDKYVIYIIRRALGKLNYKIKRKGSVFHIVLK